ncbi:Bug family tripartite tricarboxylate transporter substrate binding protein [Rhodoferax sp.]|uniref:Bug family tripartite tricarboxylate transporter substrate binding protein n=1 Tax=Rhodoferax sp. TaxID=50421 RepID=UPI00374CC9F9
MQRRDLTFLALASLAGPVLAEAVWPTRPVRILVGFAGGSSPDISARTLGDALAKVLGQPVIIESKTGASGNIAADAVAKATDDHTLGVLINGNLTSAKMLYPQLPYDPAKDFAFLSLLTTAPLVLLAPANLPGGAAFFDAARKAGNRWNYGSPGNGTVAHLGMELLKSRVPGMAPEHIPFQGNPQAVTALLAGDIQMALIPPSLAIPHVKSGKLRAIGLAGGRSALVPDVPSLAEAGVRDFNLEVWTGLVGPVSLSKAAQARLSAEIARIFRDPEIRAKLFHQGWQAVGTAPEGLKSRVQEEMGLMRGLIK